MKKRYMVPAISVVGVGLGAAYAFVVARLAHKALEVLSEPVPTPEPERKRFVRHFSFPGVIADNFSFSTIIDHYGYWWVELRTKTIAHIAACELVGTKTGLIRPVVKGAFRPVSKNRQLSAGKKAKHWPSPTFCLSQRVVAAIGTACPSSSSLARLARFRQSVGLVPVGGNQSIPTPFEAQQTYLRRNTTLLDEQYVRPVVSAFLGTTPR